MHQQKAAKKASGNAVESNDPRAQYGNTGGQECPGIESSPQRIINERYVQRGQHREQQDLRHAQQIEAQVQADVSHAKLQGPYQRDPTDEPGIDTAPARQRQKHQAGQ